MKKLLFIAVAFLGFSAASFAQTGNSATVAATATGIIVSPITIHLDNAMNFGTLVASAGTVQLVPAGVPVYTGVNAYTGGTVVPPTTAKFTVTGNYSNSFAISVTNLPTVVKHTLTASTMALSAWTTDLATLSFTAPTGGGTGTLSPTGTKTFEIGAILTVGATQEAGTYNSSAFNVTVNYN